MKSKANFSMHAKHDDRKAPRGRFELPWCRAPPALKAGAVIRA